MFRRRNVVGYHDEPDPGHDNSPDNGPDIDES